MHETSQKPRSASRLRRLCAALNGRSRRGQSLVELTLTLPILFLLVFGLVEIGWYAQTYLSLLDATREAGRLGSREDPREGWGYGFSEDAFRHNCCDASTDWEACRNQRPEASDPDHPAYAEYLDEFEIVGGEPRPRPFGYFEAVACRVLAAMYPWEFDWTRDEVVVSLFSYTSFNAERATQTANDPDIGVSVAHVDWNKGYWDNGVWVDKYPNRGFARWPLERNDCNSATDHVGFTLTAIGNSTCDPATGVGCANHRRADGCWGSEWDPVDIDERLSGMVEYTRSPGDGRDVPPGGIVLVEVFWMHDQLLNLPFFNMLANPLEIYVWVMFPNSFVQPTPTPIPPTSVP
mgnify:CR=1 FL=1